MNETLKRIQDTQNVMGTMVINHDGVPTKSSIDSTVTAQVSANLIIVNRYKMINLYLRIGPYNNIFVIFYKFSSSVTSHYFVNDITSSLCP